MFFLKKKRTQEINFHHDKPRFRVEINRSNDTSSRLPPFQTRQISQLETFNWAENIRDSQSHRALHAATLSSRRRIGELAIKTNLHAETYTLGASPPLFLTTRSMTHGNVHGRGTIKSWWRDSRGERLRAWLWPTSLAASRNSSSDGAIDERFEAIASPLEKLSRTHTHTHAARSCGIVKYDAVAPSPCPLCPYVFPFKPWSRIVNTGQPEGPTGFGSALDKSSRRKRRNFFLSFDSFDKEKTRGYSYILLLLIGFHDIYDVMCTIFIVDINNRVF